MNHPATFAVGVAVGIIGAWLQACLVMGWEIRRHQRRADPPAPTYDRMPYFERRCNREADG